ncbi:hypothetical protein [Herbaspirillum sp. RV1423]|uniref:hypothetical protein n=1 Tax=Herbaspirillum sp. RV1423 TaxID=1443993 RepID=UPI0004ACD6D8|nr:hypothetical protein [Herbaspirillum sp. RV1423]
MNKGIADSPIFLIAELASQAMPMSGGWRLEARLRLVVGFLRRAGGLFRAMNF